MHRQNGQTTSRTEPPPHARAAVHLGSQGVAGLDAVAKFHNAHPAYRAVGKSHDPAAVALELERVRRTIEVGFTRTDGALALLVQRHDQTDEAIKEHTRRIDDHDVRLDALERTRWSLPSVAALVAVTGLTLSLWQSSPPGRSTTPPAGPFAAARGGVLSLYE